MKTRCIRILLVTIFGLSNSVIAHDEALESGWCQGGRITLLGEFQLKKQLLQYFSRESNAVCKNLRSCGQFDDDDYSIARNTAEQICYQFSERELTFTHNGDDGTVRPIFHGPSVFKNNEPDHHTLYQLDQGISFSCGLCSVNADRVPFDPIRESR